MPDPTGVRITVPPDLGDSGPTIISIATSIGDELSQLANLLNPLHDYWTGQAHDDWHPLQTMWNTAANDLMAAPGVLGTIGQTAGVNWTNYVDCEQANIRTWAH